jgi:type II secretory ATPase GspE/PulE/Tfp pilus assembly ATPase PilB-like protein
MPNPPSQKAGDDVMARLDQLSRELETERRMREVTDQIHSLSLDEIILSVREDVQRLVNCERVTIFAKEPSKEELYSKSMDGNELKEIRVAIGLQSLAGFVAKSRRPLRIADVYDAKVLSAVDPGLKFDPTWDRRSGFKTRQVLAVPILKEGRLYGVIECINTRDGLAFRIDHEVIVDDLAKTLSIAFANQQKIAVRSGPHDLLLKNGKVGAEQLDQAAHLAQKEGISVEQVLLQRLKVDKADLGKSLSEYYRTSFLAFSGDFPAPTELLDKFTVDYLKHHLFVPLSKAGNRATIAMANPKNLTLRDDVARRLGMEVVVNVATREDVLDFIDLFLGHKPVVNVAFDDLISEIESEDVSLKKKEEGGATSEDAVKEDDAGMVRLVNQLIEQAHDKGASDIHVEPYLDGDVVVRVRVDGVCTEHARLPRKFGRNIVARIKIMANLDIAERRIPQDGKIRFKNYGSRDIELRVATIPTTGAQEDAVLRILAASKPLPLEKLGMESDNRAAFEKVIQEPYGMILCVGPTGSGKTTTLHSALGYLNKPDVKIWTAEDPVEITQQGLRQVAVIPKIGFTFEKALRSFLRCDPDIIMIGEMRDFETASAAIEASLTGHMVFSTLHTNNAPETITRLLDMGLDPFTFGDSLLMVIAQRLIRTLCKDCKEGYTPDEEEWAKLRREFGNDALFDKQGYVREKVQLFRPKGCERCNRTGYRGRAGIHEILTVNDEIRHLVYSKALSSKVRDLAVQIGMVMLKQDGIRKIVKGVADLAEVRSVCMK